MRLSKRERQILLLLANGKTKKEIALELFIQCSTVESHVKNIYKNNDCNNLADATILGVAIVTGIDIRRIIHFNINSRDCWGTTG